MVLAQSPEALRRSLPEILEDASNELPALARMALHRAQLQWAELDCHIAWCDERIKAHVRSDEHAKAATQLCGIGPVTASALVANVGDFRQFKTGAQFGSWLGLVPSQNSSGGRASLGGITKRETTREWSPAERFVSGPAPTRSATSPSVQSVLSGAAASTSAPS